MDVWYSKEIEDLNGQIVIVIKVEELNLPR